MGTAGKIIGTLLVIVVLALALGTLLGQPVLLGFVETGSMSSTLEPGDGFIAVPAQVAGPIEEGDVVVFEAKEIQGGGLTTHRVVGETSRGYITKGDNNPFTDQDADEPPVKEAQIVAVALNVNGRMVSIPHLGTAVGIVQSGLSFIQRFTSSVMGTTLSIQILGYLLFASSMAIYMISGIVGVRRRDRHRTTTRETGTSVRLVLLGLAVLLVASATGAMVLPGGSHEYGVVSTEGGTARPGVIEQGGTEQQAHTLTNKGTVPIMSVFEPATEGVTVRPGTVYVLPGSTAEVTVTLSAPDETGYYRRYLVEHRYLAVLPAGVIDALYEFHPWAPVVATDALLAGAFLALTLPFAPSGRVRERSRETGSAFGTVSRRLKRLFG